LDLFFFFLPKNCPNLLSHLKRKGFSFEIGFGFFLPSSALRLGNKGEPKREKIAVSFFFSSPKKKN